MPHAYETSYVFVYVFVCISAIHTLEVRPPTRRVMLRGLCSWRWVIQYAWNLIKIFLVIEQQIKSDFSWNVFRKLELFPLQHPERIEWENAFLKLGISYFNKKQSARSNTALSPTTLSYERFGKGQFALLKARKISSLEVAAEQSTVTVLSFSSWEQVQGRISSGKGQKSCPYVLEME